MERETLLLPSNYVGIAISESFYSNKTQCETDETNTMPMYQPDDDFTQLLHVALRIRKDLQETPGHVGFNVSEDNAISCVPDRLYMFLNLVYGRHEILEHDTDSDEHSKRQLQVLSVSQDIIYGVSGGKKWTPKHTGLASTLHQQTRSKQLVQLLHVAGHIVGYEDILRVDTSLAQESLTTMDPGTGFFTPPNLVVGQFTHYTADNLDINDGTLDGKKYLSHHPSCSLAEGSRQKCAS